MKIKGHILPVLIAVAILVVVGGIFFGVLKTSPQDQVPQESENDHNNESPSLDPALIQLPEGYDILVNNNPTMREDLKKSLTSKFGEIIKGLKADTSNSLLWSDLGSVKYAFEDYKGAEAAWRYAIEINPLATSAHMNLAALYQYKVPNYPEAERMLRTAIKNEPRVAIQAYSELFDLYRYRYAEKANLAEGVMLEAYRAFPEQHAILKTLAWHFLEKGDTQRAIEYFEKFLAKVPNDPSALEELERLRK